MDLLKHNELIEAKLYQGFTDDPLHLRGGSLRLCFFKPGDVPPKKQHFDATQLIPGTQNMQYALAAIDTATIEGCVYDGEGKPLQCAFASDGLIHDIEVYGCFFKTSSTHYITLSGLCTGRFFGNTFTGDEAKSMKFYPARVGGRPDEDVPQVFILHFKDDAFNYRTIETDRPDLVQDFRQVVFNTTDKFLINFDKEKFDGLAGQVPKAGGREMGRAFQKIALQCGDLVTEFTPRVTMIKQMKLSDAGLKRLVEEEGFETSVYKDIPPDGYDTIGAGHKMTDEEIAKGAVWLDGQWVPVYYSELTETQVHQLLRQDVESREVALSNMLDGVEVTQRQFDALFEFMYNVGEGAFANSGLLKALKAGRFDDVPTELRKWNIFKGKVLPALAKRRERTIECWLGTAKYRTTLEGVKSSSTLKNNTRQVEQRKPDLIEQDMIETQYENFKREYEAETKGNQTGTRTTLEETKPLTKPAVRSKMLISIAGLLIAALTAKFGTLDPAVSEFIKDAVMFAGLPALAALRKWFTSTALT